MILFTAALIFVPLAIFHEPFQSTFYRAMTVMVVASPCALVISTPASILSAIAAAARRGVLFKGGVYLEKAAAIDIVAFDKTGTLTEGRPVVTDLQVIVQPGQTRGQSVVRARRNCSGSPRRSRRAASIPSRAPSWPRRSGASCRSSA